MRFKILGLLALATAISLYGVINLGRPVSADSLSLTPATASAPVGGSATFNMSLLTGGGHNTTVTATPAGAATITAVGGAFSTAGCASGLGTGTLTLDEALCGPGTVTVSGTFTVGCVLAGTVTITPAPVVTGSTASVTLTCGGGQGTVQVGSAACPLSTSVNAVVVCKVNQNGVPLSATFALVGPQQNNAATGTLIGGSTGTTELVTSSSTAACTTAAGNCPTGAVAPGFPAGTCASNITVACSRHLTTTGATAVLGVADLADGVYTLTEITAPGGAIQIQIVNGLGQIMPPGTPLQVTIPCASTAACTFLFTNSQPLAGAATATGSAVVAVIGGSTFGLTNRTHVEIAPAPGSDDDARIDIRIRDSNNVAIQGAHVIVMTDKGRLAMRQNVTQTPSITGYDVVEPASPDFGSPFGGDHCDQFIATNTTATLDPAAYGAPFFNPYLPSPSQSIQDGFTNDNGIVSACLYVSDDLVPGITPGKANITVIVENFGNFAPGTFGVYSATNLVLTQAVTVVGPPASVKVAASPTSLQCGEKATITATITDSIGQNVSDHTRVELVSNFGATIGGTGATLGFPGTGPVNPISSSAAETFSGVATAFLLTSTEHVGPYEVVVTTGGSTGGVYFLPGQVDSINTAAGLAGQNFPVFQGPQVIGGTGVFSTAPVSAQVTVTCALPGIPVPIPAAPIASPRLGEGIRPPNTGDAGLADTSGGSWAFVLAGALVFALAGVASVKFARR